VALKLKRKGIERVFPMSGGIEDWLSEGYPVADEDFEFQSSAKN
jgi:rhodanese-related sulfurtransferase